jgi:hypothetical protein
MAKPPELVASCTQPTDDLRLHLRTKEPVQQRYTLRAIATDG